MNRVNDSLRNQEILNRTILMFEDEISELKSSFYYMKDNKSETSRIEKEIENLEVAILALKKQKPIMAGTKHHGATLCCPSCGLQERSEEKFVIFCQVCGQAVIWERNNIGE